jgi:hypothetical protein
MRRAYGQPRMALVDEIEVNELPERLAQRLGRVIAAVVCAQMHMGTKECVCMRLKESMPELSSSDLAWQNTQGPIATGYGVYHSSAFQPPSRSGFVTGGLKRTRCQRGCGAPLRECIPNF